MAAYYSVINVFLGDNLSGRITQVATYSSTNVHVYRKNHREELTVAVVWEWPLFSSLTVQ
jgi:hypothetical protein